MNQTVNKGVYWDILVDALIVHIFIVVSNFVLISNRNASKENFNNKDVCYKHQINLLKFLLLKIN